MSGKRTFFKHQILRFANKIVFEKFSFLTLIINFAQAKIEIDFGCQNMCFLYHFAMYFFWQKTLKKVMDVFRIKVNISLCKMDNECQKK